MPYEKCESKLSNLLASFDNLPENDFEGLKRVFFDVVRELERNMEEQGKDLSKLKQRFQEQSS